MNLFFLPFAFCFPQKAVDRGNGVDNSIAQQQNSNRPDTNEAKDSKAASRFTIYKVNKASRKKREKSSAKKERKATKTLAIVLGKWFISSVFYVAIIPYLWRSRLVRCLVCFTCLSSPPPAPPAEPSCYGHCSSFDNICSNYLRCLRTHSCDDKWFVVAILIASLLVRVGCRALFLLRGRIIALRSIVFVSRTSTGLVYPDTNIVKQKVNVSS